MKKFFIFLLLVGLGWGGYYVYTHNNSTDLNFTSFFNKTFSGQAPSSSPVKSAGAAAKNKLDEGWAAGKKIETSTWDKIQSETKNAISHGIDEAKTALGLPSSTVLKPVIAGEAISGSDQNIALAPVVKTNQAVSFALTNTDAPGTEISYEATWGDGKSGTSHAILGKDPILISHKYVAAGDYSPQFVIRSPQGNITYVFHVLVAN